MLFPAVICLAAALPAHPAVAMVPGATAVAVPTRPEATGAQLVQKRSDGIGSATKAPARGSSAEIFGGSSADRYGGSSADRGGVAGPRDRRHDSARPRTRRSGSSRPKPAETGDEQDEREEQ